MRDSGWGGVRVRIILEKVWRGVEVWAEIWYNVRSLKPDRREIRQ
jgi:hypothetical protein